MDQGTSSLDTWLLDAVVEDDLILEIPAGPLQAGAGHRSFH